MGVGGGGRGGERRRGSGRHEFIESLAYKLSHSISKKANGSRKFYINSCMEGDAKRVEQTVSICSPLQLGSLGSRLWEEISVQVVYWGSTCLLEGKKAGLGQEQAGFDAVTKGSDKP